MYGSKDNQKALEVSTRLDECTGLEQVGVDHQESVTYSHGYVSRHLFEIEEFVQAIKPRRVGEGKDGFFEGTSHLTGMKRVRPLYLGKKYYQRMNDWLSHYSDVYHYSARIEAFYSVCKELGLLGAGPFKFGDEPRAFARADGVRYMDLFNILIERVYARSESHAFKERERLRLKGAERNAAKVLALEEAMFSAETGRSRWLVLSLTLCYKPEFRRWITPETIQKHRERFFAGRDFNTLMFGIQNYVWTIEQGEKKGEGGLHLHVILFYSAEHNHDEYIANQICDYWNNTVTHGKGESWNSNTAERKRWYKTHGHGVGVGQINWNDVEKREALRKNLLYLAKAEQHLRAKPTESMHTFGTGQMPKKGKPGRPRGLAYTQVLEVDGLTQTVGVFDNE